MDEFFFLINVTKQQIILKARSFTKNRLRHNMQIKAGSVSDSITDSYSKDLMIY